MKKNAILLALLAASGVAGANTVRQAIGTIEATVNIKDGAVQGCGQRFLLMEKQPDSQGARYVIDVSVSLYTNGHALLKGGLSKFKPDMTRVVEQIDSFWIKGQGLKVTETKKQPGFMASHEPKGYLLAGTSIASASEVFSLFAQGKQSLMAGARMKGASIDIVLSGEFEFTKEDGNSFSDCIGGLLSQIKQAP